MKRLRKRLGKTIANIRERGIPGAIVEGRKVIEIIFIIIVILSLFQIPLVKINYDLTEYLPDDTKSRKAINIMRQEFGFPGTARLMLEDVSIYEAFVYRQVIENIDGVDMVNWMPGEVYMTEGFLMMDRREDYYKDRCAVMDITFDEGDTDEKTKAALKEIMEAVGDRGRFSGSAVEDMSLEETLSSEIKLIMGIAVVLISLILTVTTTSWFEPVLFLSVMGVAIVINNGTNIIFGTISFLSNSIAALLQLATSMDYSVFLLHTYIRCKKEAGIESTVDDDDDEDDVSYKITNKLYNEANKMALVRAIKESAMPILSSAMTTFMGFIALCTMRFGLGKDVGLVLGKSIICSVLTVLLLMPALLLRFGSLVDRTAHRSFLPDFSPLGKSLLKTRYVVLVLMVLITPFCYTAQNMNSFTFGNSALGRSPGTKAYEDTLAIEEKFGRSNLYLMMVPNGTPIKERKLCEEIADLPYVKSVRGLSYTMPEGVPEEFLPESIRELLRTQDYARFLIYTRTDTETELAFETSNEMEGILKKYYPDRSHILGNTPSTMDLKELMVPDYARTNIISLLAVGLVVAVSFKSLFLAVIVLIPICIATYMNMTVPYLVGESFMFNGFMIVSCIQLGATVDYAILLTSNYMDARKSIGESDDGSEKKVPAKLRAAAKALGSSLLSIFTSGSILTAAGYALYFASSVSAISSLGHLVGRGALISMGMVILGVPALLCAFDRFIYKEPKK